MIKSYKLKIYANKNKLKELNKLFAYWQDQVNYKIAIFWEFKDLKGSYPPKEHILGGRLIVDSSNKAWQIVKGAKATKQKKKPEFKGREIDLNQFSARIISDFRTKGFDIWFNVISLNKGKRLKIPCKKTRIYNEAMKIGELRKSFKLQKVGDNYYVFCFVELPEKKKENKKLVGIDVGLTNAVVTSDGKVLGKELRELRIRTKHRKYKKKLSPMKQGLNHCAKELAEFYANTDFVVEDLLFKGKKGRSKKFRRRNNTWAYNHLARRLESIGKLEGFQLLKVNPAYSSQQCPMCGFIDKMNRKGEIFLCGKCGFEGNADHVGAINVLSFGRVVREHSVPLTRGGKRNVC